jgi:hypothetical protein
MKVSSEINWMISKAVTVKEYAECIEKKFTGVLPYAMIMKAIKNNTWNVKEEGGQGRNAFWNVFFNASESVNYGFHYNCNSGVVEFTIFEAK